MPIAEALRTFPGIRHRLEPIGEVGGVRYVNDSKATNVAAALRGLAAYADEPVHLILGGSLKGESFAPLADAIGPNVLSIHLIGEAAGEIARVLGDRRFDRDETLANAVSHAAELADRGRGRAPQPGVRELRPVRQLRAARRRVQGTGRRPVA